MKTQIIDNWEPVFDSMKRMFINELTEKYNIIYDERFMTFGIGYARSLTMGEYEIYKSDNEIRFNPNREFTNTDTILSLSEAKLWNDKAKEEINKIDNLNKLIDKI